MTITRTHAHWIYASYTGLFLALVLILALR